MSPNTRCLGVRAGKALALTLGLVTAAPAQAQLGFAADGPISLVFGGTPQLVRIRVHCNLRANPTAESVEGTSVTVCFRLFQEASGMAMPLRPAQPWKVLTLLPGQTLVETVSVEFPSVKRATDGLVRWEAEDGSGLGSTRVRVLPPNVLGELNLLAGRGPVGVVDAAMESRATLERAGVVVEDLANLPRQPGAQLILIWPGELADTLPVPLARRVQGWVDSGRNVIWFKTDGPSDGWAGPWAEARRRQGVLVLADAGTSERLETAAAQWRLVTLARWACRTVEGPDEQRSGAR
jgi:hypothetical protein